MLTWLQIYFLLSFGLLVFSVFFFPFYQTSAIGIVLFSLHKVEVNPEVGYFSS